IAASRGRAVARGNELETRMPARVLDCISRLVCELAEGHLPRMRRDPQHEDVGARAEDALDGARQDDAAHLGMLETESLERIGELDVYAEIVGIELELVNGTKPAVFVDPHRQRRDCAVERELP